MLQLDGKDAGALMEDRKSGAPPHWTSYVSVANLNDSAEKAQQLGGKVIMGPLDVMDVGRMAVVQDPTGAVFALWQPGKHIGASVVNQPGAPTWNELATNDTRAAGEFYTGLFGWTKEEMDMGPSGTYTIFKSGDRGMGGMYSITPEMAGMPPNWIGYFAVADCDDTLEKAKALGAQAVVPPTDIPNVGRFAMIQDPQGAAIAFIKLNNPEL
jgi:predicted enzyme related to lactoylglutathione lyase